MALWCADLEDWSYVASSVGCWDFILNELMSRPGLLGADVSYENKNTSVEFHGFLFLVVAVEEGDSLLTSLGKCKRLIPLSHKQTDTCIDE